MWLTNSSIGRKLIMALTGAFLFLFVTFHCLMNAVAIFWPAAYNVVCAFLGANWYALIGSAIIAAAVIVHIILACCLTVQNRKARGNDRYLVTSRPPQVEWASKNMLVLGIVILAFIVVHLIQFWAKMQWQEVRGELYINAENQAVPPAAGTLFIQIAFGQWWTLLVYGIGFIALWFHLNHGFWSMMQTVGWNNKVWLPRLKKIGLWWTTIVIALFFAEGIVFTVQAHKNAYTDCDALKEQYVEMAIEHQDALVNGVAVMGVTPCPTDTIKATCVNKASCTKEACAKEKCAKNACTKEACAKEKCAKEACAKETSCTNGCNEHNNNK